MIVRRLDSSTEGFASEFSNLLAASAVGDPDLQASVAAIVARIRADGDAALLDYTARFDGITAATVADLKVDAQAMQAAWQNLASAQRDALDEAAGRIVRYHRQQLLHRSVDGAGDAATMQTWWDTDALGNRLGERTAPLHRVGVYVPGGQAAYPSTVLMTLLPAQVAGVQEVAVVMPCPDGETSPLALAALHRAGATECYRIGGAQAVAALAWGTQSICRVDKIVGPGGAWVTEAKRQVFGQTGIDLIAGPSEVVIIADGSAPPDWMAFDLFAQAEHDALARSLLLCPHGAYLDAVVERLAALLPERLRRDIIARSLSRQGALIRTRSLVEAVELANRIAPEHLELAVADPESLLPTVRHAGAIFLGARSPEVMGDYVAGPSHVLPTSGSARFSSPLGVDAFQARSSLIQISERGAEALAPSAAQLARGEGLEAHAQSAALRIPISRE